MPSQSEYRDAYAVPSDERIEYLVELERQERAVDYAKRTLREVRERYGHQSKAAEFWGQQLQQSQAKLQAHRTSLTKQEKLPT